MDAPEPKFHLSQPPELFARVDQEPEADEFGESIVTTTVSMAILLAGYVYVWRKGALDWGSENA